MIDDDDNCIDLPKPDQANCNGDGDVDLDDYIDLESCLLGPDGGLGTGCECSGNSRPSARRCHRSTCDTQ